MKQYTIATVSKIVSHSWFVRTEQGIQKFGHDTGHTTFLRCPPRIDDVLEEQAILEVLAQGVDALCLMSFSAQVLETVLSKAREQGTLVITHEAPNQRSMDYDIEAFDNMEYGAHLMDHLAEYMRSHGEYVIFLENLVTKSQSEWAEGARIRQQEQYPNMRLVTGKIEYYENQNIAYAKTKKLVTSYPNLRGMLGFGVASIPGASRAIDEEKHSEQVKIVGHCLVSMSEMYLRKGTIQLVSSWDPANVGYVMNKLAVMALNNESITDGMALGVPGYNHIKKTDKVLYGSAWIDVTKDNMDAYNF